MPCEADSTIFPMAKCSRNESTIRELKKGAGRKMIKSNSPTKVWDDCIEIEMEIRSCMTNTVSELKGVVS